MGSTDIDIRIWRRLGEVSGQGIQILAWRNHYCEIGAQDGSWRFWCCSLKLLQVLCKLKVNISSESLQDALRAIAVEEICIGGPGPMEPDELRRRFDPDGDLARKAQHYIRYNSLAWFCGEQVRYWISEHGFSRCLPDEQSLLVYLSKHELRKREDSASNWFQWASNAHTTAECIS
jgi:hypothetical protein